MNFIYLVESKSLEYIVKNGISISRTYRGEGILIYPIFDIDFVSSAPTEDSDIDKEELLSLNKKLILEKWISISGLIHKVNESEIAALEIKLKDNNYPIKVFIDIHSNIALKFATKVNTHLKHIEYASGKDFLKIVNQISYPRYLLEGSFTVANNADLSSLLNLFIESGGGIWGTHSLDFLTKTYIDPSQIIRPILV